MRYALDSNVMIYAEGSDNDWRSERALSLLSVIAASDILVPIHAVGETAKWLVGRGGLSKAAGMDRAAIWLQKYPIQETTRAVMEGAFALVEKHKLQFWDALILSSAQAGAASVLLSEDLQNGFKWNGVKVINPFATKLDPVLRKLLGGL